MGPEWPAATRRGPAHGAIRVVWLDLCDAVLRRLRNFPGAGLGRAAGGGGGNLSAFGGEKQRGWRGGGGVAVGGFGVLLGYIGAGCRLTVSVGMY